MGDDIEECCDGIKFRCGDSNNVSNNLDKLPPFSLDAELELDESDEYTIGTILCLARTGITDPLSNAVV